MCTYALTIPTAPYAHLHDLHITEPHILAIVQFIAHTLTIPSPLPSLHTQLWAQHYTLMHNPLPPSPPPYTALSRFVWMVPKCCLTLVMRLVLSGCGLMWEESLPLLSFSLSSLTSTLDSSRSRNNSLLILIVDWIIYYFRLLLCWDYHVYNTYNDLRTAYVLLHTMFSTYLLNAHACTYNYYTYLKKKRFLRVEQ